MKETGMNLDVRENLSAGMDGELSKEQLRFLVRRLDHDASLQQAWTRYHLARDGLRRQLPPLAPEGFVARVMQAIDQESTAAAAPPTRNSHWLRWSAGGAIAASVAAVALMVGQPGGVPQRGLASTAMRADTLADAAAVAAPAAPAAVPPWLSGNSAGLLSQQAAATFGAPMGQVQSDYAQHLIDYPPLHGYRTLNNHDGSYLLLLGSGPQVAPKGSRQASAAAQ